MQHNLQQLFQICFQFDQVKLGGWKKLYLPEKGDFILAGNE